MFGMCEDYNTLYVVLPLVALLAISLWMYTKSSDPYDLFHLSLNRLPGEDDSAPPKTEWLNMGYWKVLVPPIISSELPYNLLCRKPTYFQKLVKLILAVELEGGERVLDVGHGTGESLILLLTHPSIPRPTSLTGITSLELHHQRSVARVEKVKPSTKETAVSLYYGDAVYGPKEKQDHPLKPNGAHEFDVVFALDCAYHFHTREEFLGQVYEHLTPGGRVALADICFSGAALKQMSLARSLLKLMPKENAISMEEYIETMQRIGYTDVKLEDISQDVFPGFTEFLRVRGMGWSFFAQVLNFYVRRGGARFVVAVGKRPEEVYSNSGSLHVAFKRRGPKMTAIQAVQVLDHQERSDPKPHTAYRIQVQANVRSWTMWRRYSEFDDLNIELTKSTGLPPPCPLPPKHKFSIFRSHTDPKLLEERKIGLEAYLRAIVSAKDDRWRETIAFKQFLGVPLGKQAGVVGGPPTQFSSASWLDEHQEIQNRLRDVRADINKREALSAQGDVNASHKSNVAAKTKLAGVLSRIGNLGRGLQELAMTGMSEGELQRRTDMVARLQDDCEKLGKMVSIARQQQPTGFAASAPASDREALMGGAASGGGNTFARVTRVFGAPVKPEETEETRPLDNQGVFSLQQTQMHEQDSQLTQLTTILHRQRHLGEAISAEIGTQIHLLDDLSNEVDQVGGKLTTANKQLNRLG
ncbi:hypothetical protein V5O48_001633 [Marasmius crinis-equi]|uniref:Uncharacterized protein n=1 Tax=Marasmius crinis-equi TaxID=585013 RepID=A0ABR3FXX5_9AGAR